jgi:tRNA (cytidine/uridine-2'-O-)-methyltransferase
MIHIVLVEPEIPQNAGNVARTCAALGARLHLVKPMGFLLSDRHLRRAGVDYWTDVDLVVHKSWTDFETSAAAAAAGLFFFTRRAERRFDQARYSSDPYLVFGRESDGLSEALIRSRGTCCFRLPMKPGTRSLNLANAVAVAAYEAARQQGFAGLI